MRVGPSLYLSPSLYIVLFLFVYNSIFGSFVSLGLVPTLLLGIIEHSEFMAVGFSSYLKNLKNDLAPPWLLFPAAPAPLLLTDTLVSVCFLCDLTVHLPVQETLSFSQCL